MLGQHDEKPILAVVDEAFGPGSDLYLDVLRVQPNAGSSQIQDAYFDRRNDLFQLLADIDGELEQDSITESHRRSAERKMDAVVCSVRILGDPQLRVRYDNLRTERMKAKYSPVRMSRKTNLDKSPNHVALIDPSPEDEAEDMLRQQHTSPNILNMSDAAEPAQIYSKCASASSSPQSQRTPTVSPEIKLPSHKNRKGDPINNDHRNNTKRSSRVDDTLSEGSYTVESETGTMISDDEDETFFTMDDASISDSIIAKTTQKPKGFLDRIRIEAIGACDDATRSLVQVMNVFTLQEEEIKAVMGRIDKASRQLHDGIISTTTTTAPHTATTTKVSKEKSQEINRNRTKSNRTTSTTRGGGRKSPTNHRKTTTMFDSRRSKSVPKR